MQRLYVRYQTQKLPTILKHYNLCTVAKQTTCSLIHKHFKSYDSTNEKCTNAICILTYDLSS
jgi:hypothetical protein